MSPESTDPFPSRSADISLLLVQFGQEGPCLAADLDMDGSVSAADISMILVSFGVCPIDSPTPAAG